MITKPTAAHIKPLVLKGEIRLCIKKNPPPTCVGGGKNCYEKEKFTSCLVKFQMYNFFLNYENISLTFSKKDLSLFSGFGEKFSSLSDFSKNWRCSLFKFLGVHTFTCISRSPLP